MTIEKLHNETPLPSAEDRGVTEVRERPSLMAVLRGASKRKGMTLIEIMIVITIMVAVMGVVGWALFGQSEKANISLAETQLKSFKGPITQYRIERKKFPSTLSDLVNDGGYMSEIPVDPWGNEYMIETSGKNKVKLSSSGPDGTPNNDDDVVVEFDL